MLLRLTFDIIVFLPHFHLLPSAWALRLTGTGVSSCGTGQRVRWRLPQLFVIPDLSLSNLGVPNTERCSQYTNPSRVKDVLEL
ncbi:hypothetical protein BC826DRAFT_655225 [Russula brevipes]|nr:hypothetical protein BC826DRAFT_655225 [Russula brevipes]